MPHVSRMSEQPHFSFEKKSRTITNQNSPQEKITHFPQIIYKIKTRKCKNKRSAVCGQAKKRSELVAKTTRDEFIPLAYLYCPVSNKMSRGHVSVRVLRPRNKPQQPQHLVICAEALCEVCRIGYRT